MKRLQCHTCTYPLSTCVCKYLQQPIKNKTEVIILQHPDEMELAKNTVRLLKLQLTNIHIEVGETQDDFIKIKNSIDLNSTALLYPGEHATTIEKPSIKTQNVKTLIVIDGTWKKTNKIFVLNPWLHALKQVSFKHIPKNLYAIRKAEQTYSLSTLEAVGLFLTHHENIDPSPLHTLLLGMINEQTKYMPDHVKARYTL